MSKFPGRSGSALLVIDVQNGVVENAWHKDEIIQNINSLLKKARGGNTSVIWVQHSEEEMPIGGDDWQIVPELIPLESEPIVRKRFRSSFEETDLDSILEMSRVGHLYI